MLHILELHKLHNMQHKSGFMYNVDNMVKEAYPGPFNTNSVLSSRPLPIVVSGASKKWTI